MWEHALHVRKLNLTGENQPGYSNLCLFQMDLGKALPCILCLICLVLLLDMMESGQSFADLANMHILFVWGRKLEQIIWQCLCNIFLSIMGCWNLLWVTETHTWPACSGKDYLIIWVLVSCSLQLIIPRQMDNQRKRIQLCWIWWNTMCLNTRQSGNYIYP